MPYNSKNIKTDYNGNPIPQYFNETTDDFEDLRGSDGATHSKIVDSDGNYLSTIPVVDSDLKAEVESTNSIQAQMLGQLNNIAGQQLERVIEQLEIANSSKKIDDYSGSPGSRYIVAGDKDNGFFGLVDPGRMGSLIDNPSGNIEFNAENLALAVGITQGTAQFNDTPWMKFSRNGKVLFVPQKPIRYSTSWDHIYQAGAVYGTGSDISTGEEFMLENDGNYSPEDRIPQNARVKIGEHEYIVRLMKGAGSDPVIYGGSDRGSSGPDNEWNNLILPLHEEAPNSFTYNQYADAPRPDWGIGFTDADFITHNTLGTGSYTWTQETRDSVEGEEDGAVRRVYRGNIGASFLHALYSWDTPTYRGWRPCLELIK